MFIASGAGGMDNPSVIVSYQGNFYVSSTSPSTSNSVLRFAVDGTFLGAFVPTGSGGLSGPVDLIFRDGYLYITSWANSKVLRYDGASGAFIDEVASAAGLARPLGFVFEPNGNLLVASGDSDEIRRVAERFGVTHLMNDLDTQDDLLALRPGLIPLLESGELVSVPAGADLRLYRWQARAR